MFSIVYNFCYIYDFSISQWRLLKFSIALRIVGNVLSFRWSSYYEYTMVQWKFLFIVVPLLYSEIACVIKMQSHSDHIIDKALKLTVNCW